MSSSSNFGTGADQTQSLMIDVRANTQGFEQDLATMRGSFDNTLVAGFTQAGAVLDTGLATALQRGSLGFASLRSTALGALSDVAAQANNSLYSAVSADGGLASSVGMSSLVGLSTLMSTVLGLPGRATGGPVSPGQPYLVGENGPEMFVPTSAGAVAPNGGAGGGGRDVNVAISITAPTPSSTPQSLQRSGRQVASAVRRALTQY